MSLNVFPTLLKKLKSKEYREAYVSSNVKHSIARQIRSLREQRQWTQKDAGEKAGKPQNVISRLEDPGYGKVSIQTLLSLASAFDVALIVRFVTFEEFIRRHADVSPDSFGVPDFNQELNQEPAESKMDLLQRVWKYSQVTPKGKNVEAVVWPGSGIDEESAISKNSYSGQLASGGLTGRPKQASALSP